MILLLIVFQRLYQNLRQTYRIRFLWLAGLALNYLKLVYQKHLGEHETHCIAKCHYSIFNRFMQLLFHFTIEILKDFESGQLKNVGL